MAKPTKRPCIERMPDGSPCPNVTTRTRCPQHEATYQQRRNAGRADRYGADHRRARAALLAGGPWPCHWQYPGICTGVATQADHVDGGYVRSCGPCNSSRGGRAKNS